MIIFLFLILLNLWLILRFKSLILKLTLFVSLFPQITLLAFSFGLPIPGVLMIKANLFSYTTILTANILLACVNLLSIIILSPLRNYTYNYKSFNCTDTSYVILLIVLLITAILSYPRVSGLNFRIDLSTIFISTNVALLLCKNRRKSYLNIIHIVILGFVIIGGDRVDSMATIILLVIFTKNKEVVQEHIKLIYVYIGGSLLFILGVMSGLVRDGHAFSIEGLLYSIYAQQTVTDVLYVFLSSIEYYYEKGPTILVIYNALFGLLPGEFYGAVSPYNFTIFLNNHFSPNPGGGLFFSEGMLALGPVGVLVYSTIYSFIIKFLFKHKKSLLCTTILLTLTIMVFRVQWYGMIYCYKPLIFSLIFCYVFYLMAMDKMQIRNTDQKIFIK